MKITVEKTIKKEQEVEIEIPYYAKRSAYNYMALVSETRMLSVTSIDVDYRCVHFSAPTKSTLDELLFGEQITHEEFKAFYQQAITDIDEQTPCSDLKLSDPLPAIPY
jgi:hypothetical protein